MCAWLKVIMVMTLEAKTSSADKLALHVIC